MGCIQLENYSHHHNYTFLMSLPFSYSFTATNVLLLHKFHRSASILSLLYPSIYSCCLFHLNFCLSPPPPQLPSNLYITTHPFQYVPHLIQYLFTSCGYNIPNNKVVTNNGFREIYLIMRHISPR